MFVFYFDSYQSAPALHLLMISWKWIVDKFLFELPHNVDHIREWSHGAGTGVGQLEVVMSQQKNR